MFDHVSITVRDFAKSLAFYRAALAPLGFVAQSVDEVGKSAGFGREGEPRLWIAEGSGEKKPSAAVHLAFAAGDRAAVTKFHAEAIAYGGHDNGAPGLRESYSPTYYAAFVFDPDGNNVEAVTFAKK